MNQFETGTCSPSSTLAQQHWHAYAVQSSLARSFLCSFFVSGMKLRKNMYSASSAHCLSVNRSTLKSHRVHRRLVACSSALLGKLMAATLEVGGAAFGAAASTRFGCGAAAAANFLPLPPPLKSRSSRSASRSSVTLRAGGAPVLLLGVIRAPPPPPPPVPPPPLGFASSLRSRSSSSKSSTSAMLQLGRFKCAETHVQDTAVMLSLLGVASASAGGVAASINHSHITPLRFVHADPSGARGRRRKLSGLRGSAVHGNLHTLGYFSADVCVGTPATSFDLIVDTGSALTALPCADCSECGEHAHPGGSHHRRYDESRSSTSERLQCGATDCAGHRCTNGQCTYSVSYTEGSSIRGRMMYDSFAFSTSAGGVQSVRAPFGCQTYESGLFRSQVADGISGFSPSRSYGGTLFDWLLRATHAPDVFSICLSEEVGAMVLGGHLPPSLHAAWLASPMTSSYSVGLIDLRIDGRSCDKIIVSLRHRPPAAAREQIASRVAQAAGALHGARCEVLGGTAQRAAQGGQELLHAPILFCLDRLHSKRC